MTHEETTPGAIPPAIREFCRQIDPSREPILVPVRPARGPASGNRFAFVKDHASRHGGGVQYGWTLSEQPGWYLEAEFHGVWVAPTGELVDIVGRADRHTGILFLPDSRRTYRGESIPNRFFALSSSPDVRAIVQDAEFHAQLRAETETRARRERVGTGAVSRNDPCPCGSELKYQEVLRGEHRPGPGTGPGMKATGGESSLPEGVHDREPREAEAGEVHAGAMIVRDHRGRHR